MGFSIVGGQSDVIPRTISFRHHESGQPFCESDHDFFRDHADFRASPDVVSTVGAAHYLCDKMEKQSAVRQTNAVKHGQRSASSA
jgi:hypothetical protein